ncbi:methyltransferase domain-containing protein [Acinetobacter halotolerans]|uniref:Methyltransferase domain-containing protein n=1 Tax=Acinetobacter halotolerans TaxID=1752076 RepID=A0A4Q6XBX3_9GAMM|nr:class I SAM-dependent methyltransferase [Acinetobacter halotolerans]RZF55861.1 methyltransferase domain-containing protein [Acinetobacter halotolerans]
MTHSNQYFEALYRNNDDPWGYDFHWYEARKRQICLALLTRQHYPKVLEIGCSNGHLSMHLAERADQLLCLDASDYAVQLASQRLNGLKHVKIENRRIPQAFPNEVFDLIIISEVAYYLSLSELHQLIEKLKCSLSEAGEILCCHWRHEIQGFELDAFRVHQYCKQNLPFQHYLSLSDPDFMVDLWTVNPSTLAQQEGLI